MSTKTKRIAMWSGPRNLSTAMMYSFAQRADTQVVDEPFYGVYLRETGLAHPMREEILESMPESEDAVIEKLLGECERPVFYQKQLTHHLLPHMRRDWINSVTNIFLIRHPARVIASYGEKHETFSCDDLGFQQQKELFDKLSSEGQSPIVIDSLDINRNPEEELRKLCHAISISFDPKMLSWKKGGNSADGVWASHWYNSVHSSTGFVQTDGELPIIKSEYREILEKCLEVFEYLKPHAI